MTDYEIKIDNLRKRGFSVSPGEYDTVIFKLKDVSVEFHINTAKTLAYWILDVGQKVCNKISD